MTDKKNFFGKITTNIHDFNNLTKEDQYQILIETEIYEKGVESEKYDLDLKTINHRSDCANVLGEDFIFEGANYTLNPMLIETLFAAIMDRYKMDSKAIQSQMVALKLKLETFTDSNDLIDFLSATRKSVVDDYRQKIDLPSFQLLHKSKSETELQSILFSLVRYDTQTLSDYSFGLNNISHSTIYTHLWLYERYTQIKAFCDLNSETLLIEEIDFEKIDFTVPSVPKSIAMLKVAGFFELKEISSLSSTRRCQIIAIAIGKDPNNPSDMRSIRGNYNVLLQYSHENASNYTTSVHLAKLKKLLNN